jgi:hypothetical protein
VATDSFTSLIPKQKSQVIPPVKVMARLDAGPGKRRVSGN